MKVTVIGKGCAVSCQRHILIVIETDFLTGVFDDHFLHCRIRRYRRIAGNHQLCPAACFSVTYGSVYGRRNLLIGSVQIIADGIADQTFRVVNTHDIRAFVSADRQYGRLDAAECESGFRLVGIGGDL